MRTQVYDSTVKIRASKSLLAEAQRRARANGMTLSEHIREILRREQREAA